MKKYLSNISMSIIYLFILTIGLSLVLTILNYTGIIDNNVSSIASLVLSFVVFFLFGLIFGRKRQKKGLLNGIVLALIYGLFLLVYNVLEDKSITLYSTIINVTRMLLIISGSIIGVNLKSNN